MSSLQLNVASPDELIRQANLVGVLELLCQELDLSPTQYELATRSYIAAGEWISKSDDPRLRSALIYPHGSVALETATRPIHGDEFDVDSVNRLRIVTPSIAPAHVKQLIGNRLNENSYYASIIEEKRRCWRLNYKGQYHLDITPSIPNPQCTNGGELVPDKELRCWKPTNPIGFKQLFETRSELAPAIRLEKAAFSGVRATIESLPLPSKFKSFLKRCVQLLKRHRDVFFEAKPDLKPISVILTTLASLAYEYCVTNFEYDTEFDLLADVIRHMPNFIEVRPVNGSDHYAVWNETTAGENFAEKWNIDSRLARAFYGWHLQISKDIQLLERVRGIDDISKTLGRAFGEKAGAGVRDRWAGAISESRRQNSLSVLGGAGLGIGAGLHSVPMKKNTFHGG